MAKCGIKRFDELPVCVGLSDVDAMRATYLLLRNQIGVKQQKLKELKDKLDRILIRYKKDGDKE